MIKEIELELRLLMIAEMIPKCDVLSDIGTDHAYIPIFVAQKNLCNTIIATDIHEGPLKIARRNIENYGVTHMIQTRIGDGLKCLDDHELDIVLICGMGGLTITEMLQVQKDKVEKCHQLIVQCMYADEMLREYCYENGLNIVEERICMDRNKLYTAMRIVPRGQPIKLHPVFHHASSSLLEQEDPLVLKYLDRRIARLSRVYHGRQNAKDFDMLEESKLAEVIEGLKQFKENGLKGS